MKYRKLAVLLIVCLSLSACAGLRSLPKDQQQLVLCYDFMDEHKKLDAKSIKLLNDETVDTKTKKFIAEKINPKLNDLFPIIKEYCQTAINGGDASAAAVEAAIAQILTMFGEVSQ